MKKLLGIFAVSALTILGCTTAFASNSVQGDADSDGILTAKDSAYVLQKTLDSTFKVPIADEEYSVYCYKWHVLMQIFATLICGL